MQPMTTTAAARLARALLAGGTMLLVLSTVAGAKPAQYEKLRDDAEARLAAGDFAAVERLYSEAAGLGLGEQDALWARYRAAEARLRRLLVENAPGEQIEAARVAVEDYLRDEANLVGDRGRIGAEAFETLGDCFTSAPGLMPPGRPYFVYYLSAHAWWATRPGEEAEARRLRLLKRIVRPVGVPVYPRVHEVLPLDALEKLLKAPFDAEEEAFLRLSIALRLSAWDMAGDAAGGRVAEEFEKAVAAAEGTRWHDDAIYNYAVWLATRGPGELVGDIWAGRPDYRKAASLLESIAVGLVPDGIGACIANDVAARLAAIRKPFVTLAAAEHYPVGARPLEVYLGRRNLPEARLTLYRLDLAKVPTGSQRLNLPNWARFVPKEGLERIDAWHVVTKDPGDGLPDGMVVDLSGRELKAGAYLLTAEGGGAEDRTVLVVSGVVAAAGSAGDRALVAVASAADGAPVEGASVRIWDGTRELTGKTDKAGTFTVAGLSAPKGRGSFTAFVSSGAGPATVTAGYDPGGERPNALRVLASRPWHRPGETVRWSVLARRWDGKRFVAPAAGPHEARVDGRGRELGRVVVELNKNGFAAGEFKLPAELPRLTDYGDVTLSTKALGQDLLVSLWEDGRTGPKSVQAHGMGRACVVCHRPSH